MVAEWPKTLLSHIQVENTVAAKVPGSNPTWDLHAIFRSKSLDCDMMQWLTQVFLDLAKFKDHP